MKKVLVSIVVPVYNVEVYLEECMDSLVNQTLKDIEIICVDNRSTDKSTDIIREQYLCDPRVKLIVNEKNMGMPVSRNVGLKNAVGKYVAFVDADDVCDVTMFEKLYKMAEKTDADITTCSVYRFFGNVKHKHIHRELAWYKETGKAVPITQRPQQLLEPAGWCKLFNREYIVSIGFAFTPGSVSCEDVPGITLAFLSTQKVAFVHEALYYYRFRESGNLTATMGKKHIDHYLWGMNKQREIMTQCGLSDEMTKSYIVEFKYLMAFFILSKIGMRDFKYYFNNIINVFTKGEFIYLRRLFANRPKDAYLYRIVIGRHRYLYTLYRILRKSHWFFKRVFSVQNFEIYRIICLFGMRITTVNKKKAKSIYTRQVQTISELTEGWEQALEEIDSHKKTIKRLESERDTQQKRALKLANEKREQEQRIAQLNADSQAQQQRIEQMQSEAAQLAARITVGQECVIKLQNAVDEKAAYYKEVWCTGFIDAWKDYYNEHFGEIEAKQQVLLQGLDNESVDVANLLFERNVYMLPRQKYTQMFLYNHKQLYKPWELEGAKNHTAADEVRRSFKIPEDVLIENAVFKFESGLAYLPPEVSVQIRGRDVIDGGAYWGDSALVIGKYMPKSIRSFEPSAENYRKLLWTIEHNELGNTVIPEKLGLGDVQEEKKLYTHALSSGANVLDINPTYHNEAEKTVEEISVTTIDAYVDEQKLDVGLIKLDVEGYEFETIKGAMRTIALHKPILLVSLYHSPKDFFEIKPMIEDMGLEYKFLIRKLAYHDLVTEVMLIAYCEAE